MTAPGPPQNDIRVLWLAIGWALSVMAIPSLGLRFFDQTLQNNSQYSRGQILVAIPELLGEFVFPVDNAGDPLRPSGWQYLPERFDLLVVAGMILLFAWGWGSLLVRWLFPSLPSPQGADTAAPRGRVGLGTDLEQLYWSLVTGLAAWGTLALLLGLCGVLSQIGRAHV